MVPRLLNSKASPGYPEVMPTRGPRFLAEGSLLRPGEEDTSTGQGGKESRHPCGAPSADSCTAGQARVLGPSGRVHGGAGSSGRPSRGPSSATSSFPLPEGSLRAPSSRVSGAEPGHWGSARPPAGGRAGVGTGGAHLRPGGGDPAGPPSAAPSRRLPSSTARGSAAPPRPSGRDVTRRVLRTWSPRSRPACVVPRAGAGWRLGLGERGVPVRASAPPPRVGSPVDTVPRLAVAMLPYVAVTVAQCRFFLMSSGLNNRANTATVRRPSGARHCQGPMLRTPSGTSGSSRATQSRHRASDVSTPSGIPAPVERPPGASATWVWWA
ncbi:uncharacterized protein [Manis javanica]|uniref:uncharacterized protein n=1 Tax=Manis javanica TaxID=9974 RepID=UPI003C6D6559